MKTEEEIIDTLTPKVDIKPSESLKNNVIERILSSLEDKTNNDPFELIPKIKSKLKGVTINAIGKNKTRTRDESNQKFIDVCSDASCCRLR